MATPTIPNGEEYFFPVIYEGNGGGQRVGKFVPFTDNGTIANSCIFNSADTARMNVDFTSSGTNTKKCTISFWFKLGKSTTATGNLISAWGGTGYLFQIFKYADNHGTYPSSIMFQHYDGGAYNSQIRPNRTFEDRSKWYHLMYVWDSTESTAADRIKIYIDGDQITSFSTSSYPSSNDNFVLTDKQSGDNTTVALGTNASQIGSTENQLYDGYLAEVNVVDGTALTPSTFGVTDTSTMRWIPKTLSGITYGTNGFRLTFADSSALGNDTSGNTNDFTVANLASTDQTTDSPTQNHATLNANPNTDGTLSEGNLKLVTNNVGYNVKLATLKPTSGKYYSEFTIGSGGAAIIGVQELATAPSSSSTSFPQGSGSFGWYEANGNVYTNGTTVATSSSTYTSGDVLAIALDLDNQEVKFYKNNSLDNTIGLTGKDIAMAVGDFANGNDATITANFGQKSFTYTPPTGFVALQQDNLPETAKGISGLVWAKSRDNTGATLPHQIIDSSRGVGNRLIPSGTNAEAFNANHLSRFLKGGYATGDINVLNTAGDSMVAWNWVANGGTTASNTDGSITSTVQANTTAGFSIVQWTGDGGQSTVGHGLSSTPEIVIQKNLDSTSDWWFYTTAIDGSYDYLKLNSTVAKSDYSATAPTSTVFTSHGWGTTSMIGYCWHEVDGFSKFGSYTGNGNADGTFVYTGFKPAWVMGKQSSSSGNNWSITDSKRDPFNPTDKGLLPSSSNAEGTGYTFDFLSNGFKLRLTGTALNASGSTYFYMAFAEHPFVGDGTNPVTAR